MKFLKTGVLTVRLYNRLSVNFHSHLRVKFGTTVLYNTLSSNLDVRGCLLCDSHVFRKDQTEFSCIEMHILDGNNGIFPVFYTG
jgi:hypothetical protein